MRERAANEQRRTRIQHRGNFLDLGDEVTAGTPAVFPALPADAPRVLLSTGKLVGEGFDHPPLDTLVLAMPVSWKGTLQQYAGRLHREHSREFAGRLAVDRQCCSELKAVTDGWASRGDVDRRQCRHGLIDDEHSAGLLARDGSGPVARTADKDGE